MTSFESMKLHNIARVNANVACALIRLESMKAENTQRERQGLSPSYGEDAFLNIIIEEEIGYNDVISTLQNGF